MITTYVKVAHDPTFLSELVPTSPSQSRRRNAKKGEAKTSASSSMALQQPPPAPAPAPGRAAASGQAPTPAPPRAQQTILDWLTEMAQHGATLELNKTGLADYGIDKNLLECVPSYIHAVREWGVGLGLELGLGLGLGIGLELAVLHTRCT